LELGSKRARRRRPFVRAAPLLMMIEQVAAGLARRFGVLAQAAGARKRSTRFEREGLSG
jgi:hypothetical protein